LLDKKELVNSRPPLALTAESLIQNFNYFLSQVIVQEGKERALIWLCAALVAVYFLKNLFRYLSLFFLAPVRNGIIRDIRQRLFDKSLNLPLSYFSEERKGDLISRFSSDVLEVEWSILNVLETIAREPLMIFGALGLMIYISPFMTMFVLGLMLFTGLVIGGIGRTLKQQSSKVQDRLGQLVAHIEETFTGLRIVKAFNAEQYQAEKFRKENNTYRSMLTRLLWRRDLSSPLSEFLGVSLVVVLIWFGFQEVHSGALTVPSFMAFLYAFFSVIEPAKKFSSASYNIQKGLAALERVDKILLADNKITDPTDPVPLQAFATAVEYSNVSFRYAPDGEPVLQNINLVVPRGKSIALVGASGAGKSTLVDLLPRFYDVSEGCITIDGIDIRSCSLRDLRKQMGMVSQEAILFNDSIFNNIAFGTSNATLPQVVEAAKIANAHDFILATEHGYETNIGDRGLKLSGGQRQRLTIARAVLKNPPILILDEATSALDSESEKLVQEALVKLLKNRTSLVIAHRLSTIQHADEIIVLKDGCIIERGNHQALLRQGGEYHKLVALQAI
jgi:subfamily B ATP-binding cassette protein MsbA